MTETGLENFNEYYKKLYGSRWKLLRESLLEPALTVPYSSGLVVPYYLDSASILAAASLRLPDAGWDTPLILDACAAPGGKTLVIASRMAEKASLLSNEFSAERRRRLAAVLDKHLPEAARKRVTISGFDAAAAAGRKSERGRFAAVLLDAPCSSERHVIQSASALETWTPARPRFLARRQWALLSSAFLLLAEGGSLVYATCSINTEENDGVVNRLLEKYGGDCILDKPECTAVPEETRHGCIILPDRTKGAGPMYIARFWKKAKT